MDDLDADKVGDSLVELANMNLLKGDAEGARKFFEKGEDLKRQNILKKQNDNNMIKLQNRSKIEKLYNAATNFSEVNDERSFRIAAQDFQEKYPASKKMPLFDNGTFDSKTGDFNVFKEGVALNLIKMRNEYLQQNKEKEQEMEQLQDRLYLDKQRFLGLEKEILSNEILRQRKDGMMSDQSSRGKREAQKYDLQKEYAVTIEEAQKLRNMILQTQENKTLMQKKKEEQEKTIEELGKRYASTKVEAETLKTPEFVQKFQSIKEQLGSASLQMRKQIQDIEKSDLQIANANKQLEGYTSRADNLTKRISNLGTSEKSGFLQMGVNARENAVGTFVNQMLEEGYGIFEFSSKPDENQKEFFKDEVNQASLYYAYHNPQASMDEVISQGVKKVLGNHNLKQHFKTMSKNIKSLSDDDEKEEQGEKNIIDYETGKDYPPGTLVRYKDPDTDEESIRQW